MRAACGSFHEGDLPETFAGFAADNENAVFTALKAGEDTDAPVFRFFEAEGAAGRVNFTFCGIPVSAPLTPHAVTTLDVSGTPLDFMEWKK